MSLVKGNGKNPGDKSVVDILKEKDITGDDYHLPGKMPKKPQPRKEGK